MSRMNPTGSKSHHQSIGPDDRQSPLPHYTDWNDGKGSPETREILPRPQHAADRVDKHQENETIIEPDEGTPPSHSVTKAGKSFYERLKLHNRDCWWRYREDSTTSKDVDGQSKRHIVHAFAGQVGMNTYQKQRAYRRLMRIDLPHTGISNEINIFIICVLIVNDDAESYGREKVYHPQRGPENNHTGFQRLADSLASRYPEINPDSLTRAYNKHTQGSPPQRSDYGWAHTVQKHSHYWS